MFSPLFFSVYLHIITLSLSRADIRKIKNTTGEPESAENTRYRVMIRYVFCLEIIASQIWALFEFLFFSSVASFFSSGLRDDSSSSTSSASKRYARENTRHHSLTFFLCDSYYYYYYYYYSDGASYSQAMCSPKLNPLIVSGMFFKQQRGASSSEILFSSQR